MKHKFARILVGAVLSALFTADAHANRACCSTDGTCKMVQERDQCANGEIQGRGVTCADNPCCEEELAFTQQKLEQALADLEACQQALAQSGDCQGELDFCEDNLDDCDDDLFSCGFDLDDCEDELDDCEEHCY